MISIDFNNITKKFARSVAVDDVSFSLVAGEMFFLLGPSGCGKTTCLRMAAGFAVPDSGEILFGGVNVSRTPPYKRNVGMVFQTYALFPHLTVEKNIAFGLKYRKLEKEERRKRIGLILEKTRLDGLGSRLPAQLSGGQQQRVALARALVIQPDLLLLDEPLSNLDTRLRVELREEIRRIHNEFHITTLYVTHDQEEALSLADRLAVMRNGRIEQLGTPQEIYSKPVNEFVARFVGDTNILDAFPDKAEGKTLLRTAIGTIPLPAGAELPTRGVKLSIRPETVRIVPEGEATAAGITTGIGAEPVTAEIVEVSFFGGSSRLTLKLADGTTMSALCTGEAARRKAGEKVGVSVEAGDVAIIGE